MIEKTLLPKLKLMKVTVFKKKKKQGEGESLVNVDVSVFLDSIRTDRRGNCVSRFRSVYDSLDDTTQWVDYNLLGRVCPTSEYCRRASGEHEWRQYNGISVLNVVGLNSKLELDDAKRFARLMPQTYCAFVGADGRSLVIWTLSTLPDGTLPKRRELAEAFCAQAYATSVQCYAPLTEMEIAIEPPTLDKSCLISYDEELYVNPHPTPFIIEQPREVKVLTATSDPTNRLLRLKPGGEAYFTLHNIFNAAYQRAREQMSWVPAKRPMPSLIIIAEECARAGIPEEETVGYLTCYFRRELDETEVVGTVRNAYTKHEDDSPASPMTKHQMVAHRLREFLRRRYDIRFNEILQTTEFRERRSLNFLYRELTRRELNNIFHHAALEGIEPAFSEVDNLIHSTFVPVFNPVRDFLEGLPEWDGGDYISKVCDMVPNDNPNWKRLFSRWFLSMVAHWMHDDAGHANATAPILIGKQGYRKSSFCRLLLPPELQMFFSDSIDFRSNMEAERSLSRFLLVNIDEFDQLTEKQFAFVKHLFQKPSANIRRLYSDSIGRQRRYASFIGTTNHHEILRDPTGNRRYLCVEVTAPIHTEESINYRQLYAQAKTLIESGERYWLNDEDEDLLRQQNMEFEIELPIELIFRSYYTKPGNEADNAEWLTATEIMEEVRKSPIFSKSRDGNIVLLGKVMKKLEFESKRTNAGRKYLVAKRRTAK